MSNIFASIGADFLWKEIEKLFKKVKFDKDEIETARIRMMPILYKMNNDRMMKKGEVK